MSSSEAAGRPMSDAMRMRSHASKMSCAPWSVSVSRGMSSGAASHGLHGARTLLGSQVPRPMIHRTSVS